VSRKYKFYDQQELYFVSYATVGWIDVFVRNDYRQIIVDSLQHCIDNKGLEVYAWCIMTSHVHLIIGTHGNRLEDIMRDHKRHTSEALRKAIIEIPESRREWILQQFATAGSGNSNNRGFQLWQQHNQPIGLTNAEMLYSRLNYLHQNPVAGGFVAFAEDWTWSSARDYVTGKAGLLAGIRLLEPDTGYRI
jgi:putative transposase